MIWDNQGWEGEGRRNISARKIRIKQKQEKLYHDHTLYWGKSIHVWLLYICGFRWHDSFHQYLQNQWIILVHICKIINSLIQSLQSQQLNSTIKKDIDEKWTKKQWIFNVYIIFLQILQNFSISFLHLFFKLCVLLLTVILRLARPTFWRAGRWSTFDTCWDLRSHRTVSSCSNWVALEACPCLQIPTVSKSHVLVVKKVVHGGIGIVVSTVFSVLRQFGDLQAWSIAHL